MFFGYMAKTQEINKRRKQMKLNFWEECSTKNQPKEAPNLAM